ncbi:MAG: SHOCT domain-containing protein [Anaerolineales bacterium]
MYGNGGMMDGNMMNGMMSMMAGGMGGMGFWGLVTMLVFWVAFILLIVWLVRTVVGGAAQPNLGGARAILDQRYARGEITRKEYELVKKNLSS